MAQASEARRRAAYLELLRKQRDALPPPAPLRRWAEDWGIIPARIQSDPPPPTPPAEADRLRAIAALLRFNLDLNAPNADGRVLLMDTRGATLELLLRAGADPRRAGVDGWTALHAAVGETDPERVETLLRAGADPSARDAQGSSPLDHAQTDAAYSGDPDQAPYHARVVALLQEAQDARGP